MANLRSIKSIVSAEVEIKDEAGNPMGVFFEMAGPTHPKRKAIVFAAARKTQARFQKVGKIEFDDPEEQVEDGKQTLVDCTLSWRGYTDDNGNDVPFSREAMEAMVGDEEMSWLVDQLQSALNEKQRFMKRSAKG